MIIDKLIQAISPNSNWKNRLKALFEKYIPSVNHKETKPLREDTEKLIEQSKESHINPINLEEIFCTDNNEKIKFECQGMLSPKIQGYELNFMYAGKIEDLIAALRSEKILDLLIEEPTLEEIFLHYYDDENEDEDEGETEPRVQ